MNNQLQDYWNKALSMLKAETTEISFTTWIEPIEPVNIKNNTIYLKTSSDFHKNIIESRFGDLIKNTLNIGNFINYSIEIICEEDMVSEEKAKEEIAVASMNDDLFSSVLNPKYTFDSFVIGSSNRFAHAGAVAVAEAPGKNYNPLFIYGGSGLGKTHLMHAIGNHILSQTPHSRVLYVTSEKFTNELINSIKDDRNDDFRAKYRTIDVLMIDDIQFIAGKTGTQEEFFHTFNTLYDASKQIIISSDRPPNEIAPLENRLKTRFEWGLLADIQAPDLETRIAILKKKAFFENISVPDEIFLYIANNVASNIRELEGALNRLIAYCSLTDNELTFEVAEKALSDMISPVKEVSLPIIISAVARYFDVRVEEIKAKKKNKEIAYPRQVAMYLCREMTDNSLPKLGVEFSRDHTTIMHAIEKIKEDLQAKQETREAVEKIKSRILGK